MYCIACAYIGIPTPLPDVHIIIFNGYAVGLYTFIPVDGLASRETEKYPLSMPIGRGHPASITAALNALPGGHVPCEG